MAEHAHLDHVMVALLAVEPIKSSTHNDRILRILLIPQASIRIFQ